MLITAAEGGRMGHAKDGCREMHTGEDARTSEATQKARCMNTEPVEGDTQTDRQKHGVKWRGGQNL